MVLPDLEYYIRRYSETKTSGAASDFMRDTYLGQESRRRGWSSLIVSSLGNSKHLWMWDYKGLSVELSDSGFEKIRRARFNDASIPEFRAVEDEGRWINQLGIECWKPDLLGDR